MNISGSSALALLATVALAAGCAIAPPSVSTSPNDPSNPDAPASATRPLQPGLVAGASSFLAPAKNKSPAPPMHHGSHGTDQVAGSPHNPAEAEVAAELRREPSPAIPTSEQLQSVHPSEYTCPMHPEIHRDKPGECPECGMALVARESLKKNTATEDRP